MPGLVSKWNFRCRSLMTSYPLMEWLFFKCFRIITSMKFLIILRVRAYAILDSTFDTGSKSIYLLEYNSVCL